VSPVHVSEIGTPALVVDLDRFDANVALMASRWPGASLRPHVKAFKSTALAARLAAAGHTAFCAATLREIEGLAAAGLGTDLLLANEVLDVTHLRAVIDGAPDARITVAVDSTETIGAAAAGGVREVLIDVDVGMPRCGCDPSDAGRLADLARSKGLEVRGVMGYEGHLMAEPVDRAAKVEACMAILAAAHEQVGGEVVSGGGTGTWDINHGITELQAGSFTLMDTHYEAAGLPFAKAMSLHTTVLSVSRKGWATVDGGLKALGMDHGNPSIDGAAVWYCADEHTVFSPADGVAMPKVGDRIRVWPAHVDPTVAYHEQRWIVDGDEVVDRWPVDLRGW
jgi:D-serine deaminase-like pyridoxal phosphate-dependent protein